MQERDLGKLFIVGFEGAEFSDELKDFLHELNPCGIIFFSRNILDPLQVATINNQLQSMAISILGDGLFIGLDQEGGRVKRLGRPFSEFPSALELASSADPVFSVGRFASVTATELRLAGFNLDFTPVLDVLPSVETPLGSVIGDRSYGKDPAVVSFLGRTVIEKMKGHGVITCGKHFPGHGGTVVDSHLSLPTDSRAFHELDIRDLVPFRDAIGAGLEMIMTAHVVHMSIDPVNPATFSSPVIMGLLRNIMDFGGVVITDDLDMGAVSALCSPEESALRAFEAGADILLMCNRPENALAARSLVFDSYRQGMFNIERLNASLMRIADLKRRYANSLAPCDVAKLKSYLAGH